MVWFEKVISFEMIEMLLYVEISFTSGRSCLLDYLSGTTSRCIIFRRGNRLRGKGGGSRDVALSRSTLDPEWAVSQSQSVSRAVEIECAREKCSLASVEAICTVTSILSQMPRSSPALPFLFP